MSKEQQAEFKDPTGLTKWTKWFLYAQVVVAVLALISNVLEYQLLTYFQNGLYTSPEQAMAAGEENDARQGIVRIIQIVIFIVSGILILKWIYRANYNARQLGASGMAFTPGWSIGWYFLPIANLWKPYQAMKELWKASSNPQDWNTQSVSSLLPWWWFFWIVTNVFGQVSNQLMLWAKEINGLMYVNVVTMVMVVTGIPLSFIVIAIISRVYEMQMSHAGSMLTAHDKSQKDSSKVGSVTKDDDTMTDNSIAAGGDAATEEVPSAPYFAVSPLKLVVMSFCTLFLYQVYWFYKNWSLVKARERSNIIPAIRSVFAFFFCYSLFSKIRDTAQEDHVAVALPAGPLAALWIVITLIQMLPAPYWLVSFAAVFVLLPVQIAANHINANVAPAHDRNTRFSAGNIATIVFGGLLVLLSIVGTFLPPE